MLWKDVGMLLLFLIPVIMVSGLLVENVPLV